MIAYEGNSLINGDPIALILTNKSQNAKTGAMIQSWIIPNTVPFLTKMQISQYAVTALCERVRAM